MHRLTRLEMLYTDAPVYFITTCMDNRRRLLDNEGSHEAFRRFCEGGRERGALVGRYVLMPDHLHLIANFPAEVPMSNVIRDWKRLTTRRAGVAWQKNYFDHRVRPHEGLQQKTDYIRENPVRANLITNANDWPHFVDYTMMAVTPIGLP